MDEEKNKLLSTPKYGWTNLIFQNEKNRGKALPLSYLSDVPVLIGEALEGAMKKLWNEDIRETEVPFTVVFDGEGIFYELTNILGRICVTWDGSEDGAKVISYLLLPDNIYADDAMCVMAKMLVSDIRKDIDAWVEWDTSLPLREEEPEAFVREYSARKEMLLAMCNRLEALAKDFEV